MSARVTAGLLVSALIRRVEAEGGHAMVLAKGDATSGAILIALAVRGVTTRLVDAEGEEAARGTGTFMRSHIPLSTLAGYRNPG